jgi:hypothetical protein
MGEKGMSTKKKFFFYIVDEIVLLLKLICFEKTRKDPKLYFLFENKKKINKTLEL